MDDHISHIWFYVRVAFVLVGAVGVLGTIALRRPTWRLPFCLPVAIGVTLATIGICI